MARVCFLECLCMKLTYKKIQPPAFIFRHQIRQTGGGCWILEFLRKSFPQVGFCLSHTEADRQSAVKHRMVNYVSHIASCIHISYHHDINSSAHLSLDPTGSIFYFFCPFFFCTLLVLTILKKLRREFNTTQCRCKRVQFSWWFHKDVTANLAIPLKLYSEFSLLFNCPATLQLFWFTLTALIKPFSGHSKQRKSFKKPFYTTCSL